MTLKRPPAFDRIDVSVLAALQRDGRSTIQKLAETVGLSPRACLERVRRLEASGIISGYRAEIEIDQLSRPVTVFAEIVLEKHANHVLFERRIAAVEEIIESWELTGTVDYLARCVCADLSAYQDMTKRLVDDSELGIARIVSHVVLRPARRFAGYPAALLSRTAD